MNYHKIYTPLIICIVYLFIYFASPGPLKKIINGFEDFKFSVRNALNMNPEMSNQLKIVTVDERSINQIGRWPWNRKIIGEVLHKMRHAKLILIDIVFAEPSNPDDDRFLADVIGNNENVILGFFFRPIATETASDKSLSLLEDCAITEIEVVSSHIGLNEFPYAELNIPEISESALSCAFYNTTSDVDGILRHYPLALIYKGNIYPSLAVQGLRWLKNRDIYLLLNESGISRFELDNIIVQNTNYLRLNYYNDIKPVSAIDVLDSDEPLASIKDKIVILGVSETGIYDLRPTPVDPYNPGVYLHGTAFSNLLQNEYLREIKYIDIILPIITILAFTIISLIKKLHFRLIYYFSFTFSIFITVNLLFILKNIWLHFSYPLITGFATAITLELIAFFQSDQKADMLKKAFSSYVSPEIVRALIKNPEKLQMGGIETDLTILFSDIRGFTTISEKLKPTELIFLLKNYMNPMVEIILKNRGFLDKYIGDAIMALFNAPVSLENHPDKACYCALEMVQRLKEVNNFFNKNNLPDIDIGIGINTGKAIVGNMGTEYKIEYTAIGDSVNLASRLESINKNYKSHIIISEHTKNALKDDFLLRILDKVLVKGKHIPVIIYELMENTEINRQIQNRNEKGIELYFKKEFKKALNVFEKTADKYNDISSKNYIKRCEHYFKNPPGEDWNGVFERRK